MSTKCKSCKREVPDNATFCPWCGQKQVRERKKDGVIKVPEPKQLPSGSWHIYLAAEKRSVTETTKDRCIAKAKAVRAGFVEQQKKLPALTWSKAIDAYIADRSESLSPETVRGYRVIQRNRFHNIMQKPMSAQVNWQAEINAALSSLCFSCPHLLTQSVPACRSGTLAPPRQGEPTARAAHIVPFRHMNTDFALPAVSSAVGANLQFPAGFSVVLIHCSSSFRRITTPASFPVSAKYSAPQQVLKIWACHPAASSP